MQLDFRVVHSDRVCSLARMNENVNICRRRRQRYEGEKKKKKKTRHTLLPPPHPSEFPVWKTLQNWQWRQRPCERNKENTENTLLRSETSANAMKSHHSPSSFDSIKTFLLCLLHFLNVFACLHTHTQPSRSKEKRHKTKLHTHTLYCMCRVLLPSLRGSINRLSCRLALQSRGEG